MVETMRFRLSILLAVMVAAVGCSRLDSSVESLSPERRAAVESSVKNFVLAVAHDVTEQGPTAWQKEFADDPAFFMAVEGHLVFPNRQAATQAIQDLPRFIKHIELRWGDDLRVDPLTADLAVVATSYTEVQTDPEGPRGRKPGFLPAVPDFAAGRGQFRIAHCSPPLPGPMPAEA